MWSLYTQNRKAIYMTELDIPAIARAVAAELKKVESPAASETSETITCPSCGHKLKEEVEHCPGCGIGLTWE